MTLFHLLEKLVDLHFILALKNLVVHVMLRLQVFNLSVENIFVVADFDHVVLHILRELLDFQLE